MSGYSDYDYSDFLFIDLDNDYQAASWLTIQENNALHKVELEPYSKAANITTLLKKIPCYNNTILELPNLSYGVKNHLKSYLKDSSRIIVGISNNNGFKDLPNTALISVETANKWILDYPLMKESQKSIALKLFEQNNSTTYSKSFLGVSNNENWISTKLIVNNRPPDQFNYNISYLTIDDALDISRVVFNKIVENKIIYIGSINDRVGDSITFPKALIHINAFLQLESNKPSVLISIAYQTTFFTALLLAMYNRKRKPFSANPFQSYIQFLVKELALIILFIAFVYSSYLILGMYVDIILMIAVFTILDELHNKQKEFEKYKDLESEFLKIKSKFHKKKPKAFLRKARKKRFRGRLSRRIL